MSAINETRKENNPIGSPIHIIHVSTNGSWRKTRSVSASTGRKSQKTVPRCFSDHKKPVADTFLSLSSVLPFPAPVVLSFRSRSTFRVAPRSALFTRQGPSKPPFSIPLRTVYFSTGTGLSFPTVDHLKQLMVAVLMINAFL